MLSIATDYHGQSRNTIEIKATLTRIAQAGFSHIHWCHEWSGYYIYSVHEMLQIKDWCGELGLLVKGIHASHGEKVGDLKSYASANDYNRLAGIELIKNRVDLAHLLNAEDIVLHSTLPYSKIESEDDFHDYFVRAFKTFDELEPYCKTRNIRICIENCGAPALFNRIFDTLFQRYDKDYMGLCLDTGHAYHDCKENCLEYAERYNDRLFMIHGDDNHGTGDDHLLPFDGGFDWEGFAPLLARSPYKFPINIEVSIEKYQGEDDSVWLKKAFEAGSRFSAMVEKYRFR